jgi:hypothetical protein
MPCAPPNLAHADRRRHQQHDSRHGSNQRKPVLNGTDWTTSTPATRPGSPVPPCDAAGEASCLAAMFPAWTPSAAPGWNGTDRPERRFSISHELPSKRHLQLCSDHHIRRRDWVITNLGHAVRLATGMSRTVPLTSADGLLPTTCRPACRAASRRLAAAWRVRFNLRLLADPARQGRGGDPGTAQQTNLRDGKPGSTPVRPMRLQPSRWVRGAAAPSSAEWEGGRGDGRQRHRVLLLARHRSESGVVRGASTVEQRRYGGRGSGGAILLCRPRHRPGSLEAYGGHLTAPMAASASGYTRTVTGGQNPPAIVISSSQRSSTRPAPSDRGRGRNQIPATDRQP